MTQSGESPAAPARGFDVERFAIAAPGDSEPVRRVLQEVFREVRFDL